MKFRTTKISSEGVGGNFVKFCTNDNFPLHGTCINIHPILGGWSLGGACNHIEASAPFSPFKEKLELMVYYQANILYAVHRHSLVSIGKSSIPQVVIKLF